MKVKNLIEQLKGCDPEATVLVASDAEGNDFNPLHTVSEELYVQHKAGGMEVVSADEAESYEEDGYTVHTGITIWP